MIGVEARHRKDAAAAAEPNLDRPAVRRGRLGRLSRSGDPHFDERFRRGLAQPVPPSEGVGRAQTALPAERRHGLTAAALFR